MLKESKKKNRGQAPACREYGNILRKQDIRGDTEDVRINFIVSPVASTLKTRSHKQASGFSYRILPSMLPQVQKRCLNQSPRAVRSTFAKR